MIEYIKTHWFGASIILLVMVAMVAYAILNYARIRRLGILSLLPVIGILFITLVYYLAGWIGIGVLIVLILIALFTFIPNLNSKVRSCRVGSIGDFVKSLLIGFLVILATVAVIYGAYIVFWKKPWQTSRGYIEIPIQPFPTLDNSVAVPTDRLLEDTGVIFIEPGHPWKVIRGDSTNFKLVEPSDTNVIITIRHATESLDYRKIRYKCGRADVFEKSEVAECDAGEYRISSDKPVIVRVKGTL